MKLCQDIICQEDIRSEKTYIAQHGRMRLQDASKILNGDLLENIEKVEKENIDWIRWDHIHIDILNII